MEENIDILNKGDAPEYIEKNGLEGIEEFFKAKLER